MNFVEVLLEFDTTERKAFLQVWMGKAIIKCYGIPLMLFVFLYSLLRVAHRCLLVDLQIFNHVCFFFELYNHAQYW